MAKAQKIYKTTFKLRRGQSAEWLLVNPVLADGEPGFELDTFKLKIGDGDTPWDELPYVAQPQGEIINSNVVFVNEEPLNPVENTLYIFINTKEIKVYANSEWLVLNAGSSVDLTNYVTRDELFEELEKLEIPQNVVTREEFYSFKDEVKNNYVDIEDYNQSVENINHTYNELNETVNSINETCLTKTDAQQTFVSNQTLESKNYVTEQELTDKEYVPVTEVETIVKNEVETQIKELVTNPELDYGEVL